MPGWAKVLIIVFVLIVLMVVGVIAVGVFWFARNKDALLSRGKAEITEGKDYGKNTDNQGCVDEAIVRYKKDPGFASGIAANLFLRSCLENSRTTDGFCDVPKQSEFMESARWRIDRCSRYQLGSDNYCQQLFSQVQQFCENPSPKLSQENINGL